MRGGATPSKTSALFDWFQTRFLGRWSASKHPHALGLRGEDIACRELGRLGYTIVQRRARCRLGEIDIVAWDGTVLVFVEVKTRSGVGYGKPAEAVGWRKQKKLVTLAQLYLTRKRLHSVPVRFDVVGVEILPGKKPVVQVLRGAFQET